MAHRNVPPIRRKRHPHKRCSVGTRRLGEFQSKTRAMVLLVIPSGRCSWKQYFPRSEPRISHLCGVREWQACFSPGSPEVESFEHRAASSTDPRKIGRLKELRSSWKPQGWRGSLGRSRWRWPQPSCTAPSCSSPTSPAWTPPPRCTRSGRRRCWPVCRFCSVGCSDIGRPRSWTISSDRRCQSGTGSTRWGPGWFGFRRKISGWPTSPTCSRTTLTSRRGTQFLFSHPPRFQCRNAARCSPVFFVRIFNMVRFFGNVASNLTAMMMILIMIIASWKSLWFCHPTESRHSQRPHRALYGELLQIFETKDKLEQFKDESTEHFGFWTTLSKSFREEFKTHQHSKKRAMFFSNVLILKFMKHWRTI